ncbi:MAG: EpsI family protein [Burkholderiales bacterium]|nr:EpsI family protein [Burkholderiales bacterium]
MTQWLRNSILLASMVAASGLALALKPSEKVADSGPKVNLETMIPRQIGEWREAQFGSSQIVDPQQKAAIDKIYNQTLARTYVNSRGYAIMLSLAYGSDQSDSLQLHKPEVCYPAQGFQVESRQVGTLVLPIGAIPATRLMTTFGARREPVTYWTTVGDEVIVGGLQKKLVEMRFGFGGRIPDGMLVRISSIDGDKERAYDLHRQFAQDMVGAVAADQRRRLVGTLAFGN